MRVERPLAGLERCPPLHGGCKCIISIVKSIGARYEVAVRYWECPLEEIPLYMYMYIIIHGHCVFAAGSR